MNKVLIATHNKAKLKELYMGVSPLRDQGIAVVSLDDLAVHEDPEETGTTFRENSILKARFYANLTGLPTIADDGGLLIETLNNEPGVKSKRWMGRDATDEELIAYALHRLEDLPDDKRTAYLETTLCLFDPQSNRTFCESERIRGRIAHAPSGNPTEGYPYRALFIVEEFNKYYDELTADEHERTNHRLKALGRLVEKIKTHLLQ